ncbi:MAG: type VI secretion system tip protein VgrG, partial [Deltaproteobacteria bacterium]|nr:type VI secretion system tip protein VgrG [Deltaproteobacteria bacterium]
MSATILTADIQLDLGASFSLVGGRVSEGLSQRTHAIIEVASTTDLDFRPLLSTEVVVEIGGIEDRKWTLRLARAALVGDEHGSLRYQLDLYDAPWLLGLSTNTRKYRNRSAQEIVTQVLDEHGVPYLWQLTADTPVRKYCAQYDETNLAFVERLLESEGIYYSFDQRGTMLLGDATPAAPALDQPAPFELIAADQALDQGDVGIFELFRCAHVASGGTTLADYSWKTPKLPLRESAFDQVDTDLERYEYPAGYRKPDQGKRLAQLRLEALRAEARRLEGRSTIVRFQPAVGFTFGQGTGEQFAGEFVLVHVEHAFRHGELEAVTPELTSVEGYANHFRAIPRAVPYRPPLRTPRPTVSGSHTAAVRGPAGEDIHTDPHGRFRAQLHWDREALENDEDSRWLRKLQEVSTSINLARTSWEMFICHIDGDPDRPIGLGRAINGEAVPTYQLPQNQNVMSIKTPSSPATGGFNELRMDDSAGMQMFSIQAEKDYDAVVKNNKGVTIGNNEVHTVGTDFDRQVTGNQTISVGVNQSATVGEDQKLNVQGSSSTTVGGSMEVKLASGATIRIDCNDTELVGGLRLTVAGSFAVPDLGAMAESAARTFAGGASPGAKA